MQRSKWLLLGFLIFNQVASAHQIYRFKPQNQNGGYAGVVSENGKSYRFLTYDSWVVFDESATVDVWAVDDNGRKIQGMQIKALPDSSSTKSQISDNDIDPPLAPSDDDKEEGNAKNSDKADSSSDMSMQLPEEVPMKWKSIAAFRGRLGYGVESLNAKGGISEYEGSSQIFQYGVTLETLKDLPRDFRVAGHYLGHLSSYKTEEDVDNKSIGEIEENIRVDRLEFSVEKGVGHLLGMGSESDLSLGMAIRLTTSPIFRDLGDGSGTGFLKSDRFRTLGMVLDYRSQVFSELFRLRSNIHLGFLDKDIDVTLFDLEAVYLNQFSDNWQWELGMRNESDTMKVDFVCPVGKDCDQRSTSERTELVLFLGISSYIKVPDFEG